MDLKIGQVYIWKGRIKETSCLGNFLVADYLAYTYDGWEPGTKIFLVDSYLGFYERWSNKVYDPDKLERYLKRHPEQQLILSHTNLKIVNRGRLPDTNDGRKLIDELD